MSYTIDRFWKPLFSAAKLDSCTLPPGWRFVPKALPTFVEAPLTLSAEFGTEDDASTADLLLVSAPGAVGKSTLAQQIAHHTDAVYLNLADAGPVGTGTLTGWLALSELLNGWRAGHVALLIDGLDEARLRVTPEAFDAFVQDVARLAQGSALPPVMFGRTRAIEDAWLVLEDAALDTAVLEIDYYDEDRSREFVSAQISSRDNEDPHKQVRHRAADLLLAGLREQANKDGDRFSGYAPVLVAVADHVVNEANPAALIPSIEAGQHSITLSGIVDAILDREQGKLRRLSFDDPSLVHKLYDQQEQLDHLVAKTYGVAPPETPATISNRDRRLYEQALKGWVQDHPFLGGGKFSQSTVFDAVITTHALKRSDSADAALERELNHSNAANPFLAVFYPADVELPPEHIGILYSSIRAQLGLGETASLLVTEGEDDASASPTDALEVEISITGPTDEVTKRKPQKFVSNRHRPIRIGFELADTDMAVPHCCVQIGSGSEVTLVAPITIECAEIRIAASRLVIETMARENFATSVFLRADQANPMVSEPPVLRGDASLGVAWPGAKAYPWTRFVVDIPPVPDPNVQEGLRRLRRFVTAFRAGGKGKLARFRAKIESPRMVKGVGSAVLTAMTEAGILRLDGKWYFLEAHLLGEKVGVDYIQCQQQRFGTKAVDFVDCATRLDTQHSGGKSQR